MKFAFLLLCHKSPEQVNYLLKKLLLFDCDIYIHIDKKKYNEIKNTLIKKKNIYIIPYEKSYDIKWGGIEMIQSTLELINFARNSLVEYDYLWLLSGQDYIIKKPQIIIEKMKKKPNTNYIEIIDKDNRIYKRYEKLYNVYYWPWMTKDKLINKIIKRLYMLITGGFRHTFSIFKRKKPFKFDFYFGSQWWTLKPNIAYQILDYSNKNPKLIEYFKHTIIPDECFFQTIYMYIFGKEETHKNLTFVNWKGKKRSPDILTVNDVNMLLNKNEYFFARKFDIIVDKRIFNEIDLKLKNK